MKLLTELTATSPLHWTISKSTQGSVFWPDRLDQLHRATYAVEEGPDLSLDLKILMVEDMPSDAELAARELRHAGMICSFRQVETEADFRAELGQFAPDVVLSDLTLPTFDGFSALRIARESAPDVPFIFVSGTIGEETAISALKHGAIDYVLKSNLLRLPSAVQRALTLAGEQTARRQAEADYHRAADDLKKSAERFEIAAKATSDVIWDWDLKSDTLWLNESYEAFLGRPPGSLDKKVNLWRDAIHPDDRQRVMTRLTRVLKSRARHWSDEYRFLRQDGSAAHVLDRGYVLRDERGRAVRVIGAFMDITQRKEHENGIKRLNRLYGVLSGINAAIVRIHDRTELFTEVCRIAIEHGKFKIAWIGLADARSGRIKSAIEYVTSSEPTEGLGLPWRGSSFDALAGRAMREQQPILCNAIDCIPELSAMRDQAIAHGLRSLAILPLVVAQRGIGVLVLAACEASAFDEEELKLLSGLAADMSFAMDYIDKEEQLNYLAYYDAMTGLPNRALFHDRLQQQLDAASREQARLALLVLDVEHFRHVNDTFGRHAGDAVLKEIARRLQSVLGEAGKPARLGGDRFAVIIPDVRRETDLARLVGQDILPALGRPLTADDTQFRIACKSGIALFPNDADQADSLLAGAEAALAKAKNSGERYLFYTSAMTRRVTQTMHLENRLRRAQDEEGFVMHYQPKLDLATGQISGLEALIRWLDEDVVLAQPTEFIPILEATGMILDVGRWALRRVAADWWNWRATGLQPPPVSVNVSALQLRQARFIDEIRDMLLAETGAQNIALELEITESVIMEDIERNVPRMRVLRDMGVRIAIDDFGTGYSSLSYVAKLPVDALKIDRSFIVDAAADSVGRAIVSTIISLAHSLRLKVIAEGVESERQAAFLRSVGCEEGQGYLFSEPLAPDAMAAWLQAGAGSRLG